MVEVVAVLPENGQNVLAKCQYMIEIGDDDDFLVFFDHNLLDYLLEEYELSEIEDYMLAGSVVVGIIQEIGMNRALCCQLGTSMSF